uniref:Early protein 4 n=1 Tax=Bovine papillomavirus type 1 TaxID=337052 RepID=A0A386QVN7_BPV1|nr:early protein 4 [Deltapapillomavirus 4]
MLVSHPPLLILEIAQTESGSHPKDLKETLQEKKPSQPSLSLLARLPRLRSHQSRPRLGTGRSSLAPLQFSCRLGGLYSPLFLHPGAGHGTGGLGIKAGRREAVARLHRGRTSDSPKAHHQCWIPPVKGRRVMLCSNFRNC